MAYSQSTGGQAHAQACGEKGSKEQKMKSALKSKTLWFALALAIFGVVEMNVKYFSNYLTPEIFGLFSILISVIVAVLRVLTTTPLSDK